MLVTALRVEKGTVAATRRLDQTINPTTEAEVATALATETAWAMQEKCSTSFVA